MELSVKSFYNEFEIVELKNSCGFEISLTTCGAGIKSIKLDGAELTLTPMDKKEYCDGYQGKICGRTAGRIENACYTIDGKTAYLEKNNQGVDNLHSGKSGFNNKLFSYKLADGNGYTDVIFKYDSPDGDGGHIGNVLLLVTYRVYENEPKFEIIADGTTKTKALLNITNHVFLNLNGDLKDTVISNELYLNSSKYGVLNQRSIVKDIKSDFRFNFKEPMLIGKYIEDPMVQEATMGYDHPFFLDSRGLDKVAARLYSPLSGIELELRTTLPVIVIYTDNQADPNLLCNDGIHDRKYLAICLECQYHPNGINACPKEAGVLSSDKPYHEVISYSFKRK